MTSLNEVGLDSGREGHGGTAEGGGAGGRRRAGGRHRGAAAAGCGSQRLALLATALVALATAGGCTVEATFEPFGSDVSLSGTWTVDGAAPTAASCAALGIANIDVAFYEDPSDSDFFATDRLTFPCTQGSFDTRSPGFPGGSGVLAFGRYYSEWRALDATGQIIGRGPRELLDVSVSTHANLRPQDFVAEMMTPTFEPRGTDAELTGEWTIGGAAATAASCSAVGISDVAIVFFAPTDTAGTNGIEVGRAPCSAGKYDSMPTRVIRYGNYLTSYVALDATGQAVQESSPLAFGVVAPTTRAMLALVDFQGPAGLNLGLSWETAAGAQGSCADAGVVSMTYVMLDTAGTPIASMTSPSIACGESLTWPEAPVGTYRILIEGFLDPAGTARPTMKMWETTCDPVVVPTPSGSVCPIARRS